MTIIYNEEKVNHIRGKSRAYKESRLLELMEKQKEIAEQVNFWVKDKLFDDEYFKEFVDDNLIFCGYILYCIKYEEKLTYDEMMERGFKSVLSTSRQYISNDTKCSLSFCPMFITETLEELDKNYLFYKFVAKYFYNKDLDKNSSYSFMNEAITDSKSSSLAQDIVINFSGNFSKTFIKESYKDLKGLEKTLKEIDGTFIYRRCITYDYYNEDMRWYFNCNEVFINEFILPIIENKWRQDYIENTLITKIKELNMINKLKK